MTQTERLRCQVEGVSEDVRGAFRLLLELYEKDCQRFGDTAKTLSRTLLQRVTQLPWEARAKYPLLCALIPHLGADVVREHVTESADRQNMNSGETQGF